MWTCDNNGSSGSTVSSSSSLSMVLTKVDAARLAVAVTAEGVVMVVGQQRPDLLVEVVQLCKGLLRRGVPSFHAGASRGGWRSSS